jgi:hypothetical protein
LLKASDGWLPKDEEGSADLINEVQLAEGFDASSYASRYEQAMNLVASA